MANHVLTFTIPETKVAKALEGFLKLYPNIEKNQTGTLKYTNQEWVREKIRRKIVRDIHRGLRIIKNEQNAIIIDDAIVN